ncbi:cobaltochelatase subunit CobN [Methanosarcina sp. KYL-1]|uniref:cobaltochelatase subunit CobN n=1 Tax=Methanosarcina sp. KYL-1 TaxID=2602068 RepID=UPI0021018122|nr:cobaltochelatase subunit CobN [Methanosarcina sp. KYL-1]MCQ1534615.1 cobaltochelatase subunit CobN [Methanosarcina sp. KYL-1]
MQHKHIPTLILSLLLLVSLTTVVSANSNELTFVLGTDENYQFLVNAKTNSSVNLQIYDHEHVPDLSNASVVFLASLNDSTLLNLNLNASAVVCGYNLSNSSVINTPDNNLTKYWVYGGDSNIANMVLYMDHYLLGNSTNSYDLPEPPEDRINITYITGASGVKAGLLLVNDDPLISKYVRVNVVTSVDEMPASLVTEYIIMLEMLSSDWISSATYLSTEAMEQNNATVLTLHTSLIEGFGNVNTSSTEFETIEEYWVYKGEENMRRLTIFLAATYKDAPLEILDPVPRSVYGFYHPDAPEIYQTTEEYLEWYASTGKYNPDNITVGILDYQVPSDSLTSKVEDALISEIESRGCNAMFASFNVQDMSSLEYFMPNGTPVVDAVISLRGYSLGQANKDITSEMVIDYFNMMNVPVLHGINCFYDTNGATYQGSKEDWENTGIGLSSDDIARNIVLQEFEGIFEPIILSWKNRNDDGVTYNVDPLEDHVEWLVSRSINHARLGETPNSEKKVAILYYNHGGGKNNFNAMYLDVPESLCNLVEAMNASGYDTGTEPIPNETELVDLMILQGRNIGTWAPGELENMVATGKVVLWPVEEYMKWFSALPEENQEDIIDQWGPAPGEIMVYNNESGNYFVIPRIEFGSIILGPQPTRGWDQDADALYHNASLPPHHQYLAYYLWLQHEYEADAIMHLGTHGTQEWLPGKDVALSRYDWPAVMAGEVPIIYPYIMDDVGEGIQAKRRGSALILDHLTSPIIEARLYGGYENLSDYIKQYNDVSIDEIIKAQYRNLIVQEYTELNIVDALGTDTESLSNMTETEFDTFLEDSLEPYLESLETASMPYGMHVLGEQPPEEQTIGMIRLMLGDDYIDTVDSINSSANVSTLLLEEVLLNNASVTDAQDRILGTTDPNVTTYLEQAAVYYQNILDCKQEIPNILRALNGGYIEPDSGNDPIRSPNSLPTGINFYSLDSRTVPGYAEWLAGVNIANQTIELYQGEHDGAYPETIAFVAFSTELIRNRGITEAEVLYLLGVEPAWDKNGRINLQGFTVIPESELGRPRIDILYVSSGLYRDMYPDKLEMIDYAVRLAANAENSTYPNYVKQHSETMYQQLIAQNYTEEEAKLLSESRVVSRQSGVYGTGLEDSIGASETWDDESKLAELFIDNLDNFYGVDIWDKSNTDVFKSILGTVDVAVKSDASNLMGLVDNDDFVSWLGGLALAVRDVSGATPDLYVNNFIDSNDLVTEKLSTVLTRELTTRYFNPSWIEGMMESGFAGAQEMDRFVEFLWMWEVTTPETVSDSAWQKIYETYVLDSQNLGLEEFFKENAYNYQSITAQLLEVSRKGYWDASDEVIQTLVSEYVESVVENGVTCCHHTCGNALLDEYIQGVMSVPGVVDPDTAKEYERLMQEATQREPVQSSTSSSSHSSHSTGSATVVDSTGSNSGNQTAVSDAGYGTSVEQAPAPSKGSEQASDYVEGYEMTKETVEKESGGMSFSGADAVGTLFVLVAAGGIYLGMRKKKF